VADENHNEVEKPTQQRRQPTIKKVEEQNSFEKYSEKLLWNTRLFVILAVIFGLVSSLVLFIIASADVVDVVGVTWNVYVNHYHPEDFHAEVLGKIIGAVDLYLIAVVMLIFSFGLYELFISQVDVAKSEESSKVLEIHSLDQLKDKITKVIIMVLVVSFFQRVLGMDYKTPLEMLYLAVSIFALSFGLYYLHKH
jgi:uncharacterized membrane protein YqhA